MGNAMARGAWAGLVVVAWAAASARAEAPTPIEFQENVNYGTGAGEKLTLHLARPTHSSEPAPGLVWIHGGGWMGGDKNFFKSMVRKSAEAGYVSVTVGYRFAPKHTFPAQVEDVKCAVRWMRAHAGELGLDPERIGAVGMSAGAHLAMMLGTMDSSDGLEGDGGWTDQSSKVQAVVSYFGPVNLGILDINASPARKYLKEDAIRSILTAFIGGKPEEHVDQLKAASPLTYVNAGDAPMLLFQGTVDDLVPYDQAFQMVSALTEVGVPGRAELIFGKGHGWFGPEFARTQDATMAFFDSVLKTPAAAAAAAGK